MSLSRDACDIIVLIYCHSKKNCIWIHLRAIILRSNFVVYKKSSRGSSVFDSYFRLNLFPSVSSLHYFPLGLTWIAKRNSKWLISRVSVRITLKEMKCFDAIKFYSIFPSGDSWEWSSTSHRPKSWKRFNLFL